jgi:hypothetical protein
MDPNTRATLGMASERDMEVSHATICINLVLCIICSCAVFSHFIRQ